MRTSIVIAALMTSFSTNAIAEWTWLNGNDAYDSYLNIESIRRTGNKVKVWDLDNFKSIQTQANGKQFLSEITQIEYDCIEETKKLLAIVDYAGVMGSGEVTNTMTFSDNDNKPIIPNSIGEKKWKIVCGKK